MPDLSLRLNKDMLVAAPLLTAQLMSEDLDGTECLEYLNILDEDLVRETHRRFRVAGAQCGIANTLKANRSALAAVGLEDALEDINRAGVRLAREAGFEHIIAAVEVTTEEVLTEQVTALLKEELDALILLGNAEENESASAINAIKNSTDLPLIASLDNATRESMVDIICIMSLNVSESLTALQYAAKSLAKPLMVCPLPGEPDDSTKQQRKMDVGRLADEMVDFALKARSSGAGIIGTAPGSSPIYSGAISAAVSGLDVIV